MKKILTMVLASMVMFSATAFAKIHCSVDNIYDTVTYKANKKIMYFSRVTTIDVLKTINSNNTANYYVLVNFNGMRKKIIENRAEIVIDGIVYPIKKAIPVYPIYQDPGVAVGYFEIPLEVAEKMNDYKNDIVFSFHIIGEKQQDISLGKEENEELRLMTTLSYNDFEAVNDGKIKVITKN